MPEYSLGDGNGNIVSREPCRYGMAQAMYIRNAFVCFFRYPGVFNVTIKSRRNG